MIGVSGGYQDERIERIAEKLREMTGEKKEYLKEIKLTRFGNREGKAQIFDMVDVWKSDFYILEDVGNFKYDSSLDRTRPDERYVDSLRALGALKRTELIPGRINMVSPLGPFSRGHRASEHKTVAESLDAIDAVELWSHMGANTVMFTDHHAFSDLQRYLPNVAMSNLMPVYSVAKELIKNEGARNITRDNMIIVAPDEGARARAELYAKALGLDIAIFSKNRDKTKVNSDGSHPIVLSNLEEMFKSSIDGKDVVLIDDMIATGKTNILTAETLKSLGAKKIISVATFGIFNNGGLKNFLHAKKNDLIDSIYCTDLSYLPEEAIGHDWLNPVSGAELLAAGIYHNNQSRTTQEFTENMGTYYQKQQHQVDEMLKEV